MAAIRSPRTPTEAAWDAPESHIGVARRLQKELPNAHILDQYSNPSNPDAHYDGTAEEILEQCDGRIDMLVCSAGTGGTITGIARKFKERIPHCQIVGVDPVGSILAGPGEVCSYKVEGIGYDFIPEVLDRSLVDRWVKTRDRESFLTARRLIREEAILCGGSSGAAVWAALQVAPELEQGQRCVVILPDSVRNYMSKFLDDQWMRDNGFYESTWQIRRVEEVLPERARPLVTTSPGTRVADAVAVLREHGISQMPVLGDGGRILGVVTESGLLRHVLIDGGSRDDTVAEVIEHDYMLVTPETPLAAIEPVLERGGVALVRENEQLRAILTKIDLLHFLMR